MLRILHCVVGMNRGGLETWTMNVYRKLDRERVQFDFLVSLDGAYDEEIRALGGRVYKIPFIDAVGPFAYARRLRDFFAAHPEYTIVHIQMDKFGGMVARQAQRSGVPVRILHSHSTRSDGSLLVKAVKGYYGLKAGSATHLVACGQEAAAWMFGRRQDAAMIVKNGVDLAAFAPGDTRKENRLTIGHVGRFDAVKNHGFLLDIFSAVHKRDDSARLWLAGAGPLLEETQAKARRLGLEQAVRFVGLCTDVPGFLRGLDVFCLPSLHEGLPVSLVEAQAVGVPCLAADTVTAESNITGGVDFISLEQPPEAWAERLLRYKGKPRADNRAALTQAGYSAEETAARMQEFYLGLAEGQVETAGA